MAAEPQEPDDTLCGVSFVIVVLNTYYFAYPLVTHLAARSVDVKINGSVEFQ